MRIIGGEARGRPLDAPRGVRTRPTSDRVRESLFSILMGGGSGSVDLEGAAVLDLYAGSGALGLEALSRGAASAVFVDVAGASERVIQKNAERLGYADGRTEVLRMKVAPALTLLEGRGGAYCLVLADPPYADDPAPLVRRLAASTLLRSGGVLTLEHGRREQPEPPVAPGLTLETSRSYGETLLSIYSTACERGT